MLKVRTLVRPGPLVLALVFWMAGTRPAEPVDLRLSTSQETYSRGDIFTLVLEASSSGPSNTGDLYVSVQAPDGSVFYYLHPAPLPGAYQFRVAALDASGRFVGTFSEARTAIIPDLVTGVTTLPPTPLPPPPPTPGVRPTVLAPDRGAILSLLSPATFTWTAVPGAQTYLFEHTGPNLTFTNPLGTAPDPINGVPPRGNSFRVSGTSFSVPLALDQFTPSVLPLTQNLTVGAPLQSQILSLTLPVGLPTGRYAFSAVMVRSGTTPRDSGTFISVFGTRDVRIF